MPTYLWKCRNTGEEVTVIRRVVDIEVPPDPTEGECSDESHDWERQMCATSFSLKGGGWFSDGYTSQKKEKNCK